MKLGKTLTAPVGAAILIALMSPAHASLITLSQKSSDSTDPSLLDATLDFVISGSDLELTVSNNTTSPDEFEMNSIYFNATSDMTSLNLMTPSSGWALNENSNADGFGKFDFALLSDNMTNNISAGNSLLFKLEFTGTNVDMMDFTTELSTTPPGDMPSLAAAKFVRGPNDDSAWGATQDPQRVPVPATPGLIGLGLIGMGFAVRRRGLYAAA